MRPFIFFTLMLVLSIRSEAQNKMRSKTKFPKHWTALSRNENGYVIYQPCDGSTPTMVIRDTTLSINSRLEGYTIGISGISQVSDSSFEIHCRTITFSIRWLNRSHTMALWKSSDLEDAAPNKWIMCPTKLKDKFPFVDNPCPTQKIKEKNFLPIDID